jgi:hypothetical protein
MNRAAYERLREEILRDYQGRYVALAFGKIIGSAETYGEGVRLVQRLSPAPHAFEVFLAGEEPIFDDLLATRAEFE